ncbi:MAG TPA: hypothetical protein PK624_13665 [Spirochaetota bacterium]|nr:hypothetical protein [Spirochaetota bacterium]HOR45835.1 hypothetical protein [Spirochaetota bacterium]HPK57499.1 hypothetical protein [Spirochaetota bacterium]
MRKKVIFLFLPLLSLCMLACSACASGKPKAIYNDGEKVSVTGTIKLVGNEPMSKLVISTENAQIILPRQMKDSLKNLMGKTVTAEGTIKAQLIETADHKHSFYQYSMDKPEFK